MDKMLLTAEDFLEFDDLADAVAALIGSVHCDVEITIKQGETDMDGIPHSPAMLLLAAFDPRKNGWGGKVVFWKEGDKLRMRRETEIAEVIQ